MTALDVLLEAKRRLIIRVEEDEYFTYDSCFRDHIAEVNEIVADLKTINAPKTLKLFESIQTLLPEMGEWVIDNKEEVDDLLQELLNLPEQGVERGFYFDEDGVVHSLEKLEKSLSATLKLDTFPKLEISNESGLVIGEYSYYVNELEVKLIQAGFVLKTYEGQEGIYFYDKKVKSNHEYANEDDLDLIEYVSLLSKDELAGTLQIVYLLDEDGFGIEGFESSILLESDYGQELLQRAGVE